MPKRRHNGRLVVGNPSSSCLYIVIKDGKDRYGIRRFDLLPSDDDSGDQAARRPPPLLIRFKSPSSNFFAAIGTKIMNMHPQQVPRPVVPVFDVRTLYLTLGPKHGSPLSNPMYLPVGGRLVALYDERSSERLDPPSEKSYWLWRELPKTPFKPQDVTCHAAHPDGRTIFVSANNATYSIDTEEYKPSKWRLHGEWMLPFAGRAHFDPWLDAWVGLSGDTDTLGHLCSCDVVPSTDPEKYVSSRQPPQWKLSKEKLFRENPQAEKHVGASLVYMGVRTVCLVHYYFSVVKDDDDVSRSAEDLQTRSGILRLTTFSLKYDKDGDLCAEAHSPVRRYQLPPKASKNLALDDDPVTFWI